jgi:hypothetical protein
VALAGFLVRGGLVLLALPGVVLPSVIGIAGLTGANAFTIAGRPTPWLIELGAAASIGFVLWFLVASFVGSIVDVWLVDAALGGDGRSLRRPLPLPEGDLLLELVAVRVVCLIPLIVVVVWAGGRIYDAAYAELTIPTNLAVPLVVRVLEDATGAIAEVVLTWLVLETIAAVAVRRLILYGSGVVGALAGAVAHIVRHPISMFLSLAVSLGASAIALGLPMIGTAVAFDWCRVAARNPDPLGRQIGIGALSTTVDIRPVVFLAAVLALSVVWLAAFVLAGVSSAWRSSVLTQEVAARLPIGATAESGAGAEISAAIPGPGPADTGSDGPQRDPA